MFKGVSLNIYAVRITSPGVLPNATQNAFYSTTILAAGGAGGFTFSANGLPNGLSINSASGVISGTVNSCCSSLGMVSVNVTARDSANTSYTKTMSIDVVGAAATLPSLVPSNSNIYDCTVGVSCTRTISVRKRHRAVHLDRHRSAARHVHAVRQRHDHQFRHPGRRATVGHADSAG